MSDLPFPNPIDKATIEKWFLSFFIRETTSQDFKSSIEQIVYNQVQPWLKDFLTQADLRKIYDTLQKYVLKTELPTLVPPLIPRAEIKLYRAYAYPIYLLSGFINQPKQGEHATGDGFFLFANVSFKIKNVNVEFWNLTGREFQVSAVRFQYFSDLQLRVIQGNLTNMFLNPTPY